MMRIQNTIYYGLIFFTFLNGSCAPSHSRSAVDSIPIAFPGAEGFGKFTTGGRGGYVYKVTNLNDEGEGSLRYFLNKKGPRIIVFAVSGTIHLQSPLNIKSNTTVFGQTAPGDGICLADQQVKVSGDNVIIRYMRFRMGDRHQNIGKVPGAGHDDALTAVNRKNVIIDHCSLGWSTDEVLSAYNGDSITLQWNIISEPLNYSYHFEKGDTDFEAHGYGGIWGGKHLSAHHNLFAHCISRNPRFAGIRSISAELVDYRNNVIYNWGGNSVYGGEGGNYNLVNNYYKYGPSTKKSVRFRIVNPTKQKSPAIYFGKFYVDGNFVDGADEITRDNALGVHLSDGSDADRKNVLVSGPFDIIAVPAQVAGDAYNEVLLFAGASFKRDTLDQRIVNDVKTRQGRIIDVQGGFPHGTPYEESRRAWPVLSSLKPPVDSDNDGMPDEWEIKNGLDKDDESDASAVSLHAFYTNIELYCNSIVSGNNEL